MTSLGWSETRIMEAQWSDLQQLLEFCRPYVGPRASQLDPMYAISNLARDLVKNVGTVLQKYSEVGVNGGGVNAVLEDVNTINAFDTILQNGVQMLLDRNTSVFRIVSNPVFINCLVQIYLNLVSCSEIASSCGLELQNVIINFEKTFKTLYLKSDLNCLNFEKVRDLLSFSNSLVSASLIRPSDIVKRQYFRLSTSKLNIQNQLVEIFQLRNGQVAIFKVDNNLKLTEKSDITDIFERLLRSNPPILTIGRTLLFPSLKQNDLQLITPLINGYEFKTQSGNNIILRLTCENTIEWEMHWKCFLENMFDKAKILPPKLQNSNSITLNRATNSYRKFQISNKKLEQINDNTVMGLAVSMPPPENGLVGSNYDEPNFKNSALHRSKPITASLSSLMLNQALKGDDDESYSQHTTARRSSQTTSSYSAENIESESSDFDSLEDIESMSCDELLKMDKKLDLDCPVEETKDDLKKIKSIHDLSSVEINYVSADESDSSCAESIISDFEQLEVCPEQTDDCDEELQTDQFCPAPENHIPTFQPRKTSSLFNLFTNKFDSLPSPMLTNNFSEPNFFANKEETFIETTSKTVIKENQPKQPANVTVAEKSLAKLSGDLLPTKSNTIFSTQIVKLSAWNNFTWKKINSKTLDFSIIEIPDGKTFAVIHSGNGDDLAVTLIAQISKNWKCAKSAALDVQVTISKADMIQSAMTDDNENSILTIRSIEVDRLTNILLHCISTVGSKASKSIISKSTTDDTISTMVSSFLSRTTSRSSESSFENNHNNVVNSSAVKPAFESTLLASSLKIKHHVKMDDKTWANNNAGLLDVFAQNVKNNRVAIKFELNFVNGKANAQKNVTLFISLLENIKRVGRTGITLVDFASNKLQLLEFQNKVMADQIYKLIVS